MRILLILAGLALPLVAAPQEIYRWVDKDGIVHYSDQPGAADAQLITVIEPNAYDESDGTDDNSLAPSGDEPEDVPAASAYESLTIVQPTPDQVFFGSDATVTATAELGGTLRSDHSVVFFVNGNRRPANGLTLELPGLQRGSHFLRATVLDRNGEPVISSQQITFHVRQASTQNPQTPVQSRPQAPRPTPAPAPTPAGN